MIQAGFNAGYGRGWAEAMPSSKLQNAANLQGSNITGRYLYKIDKERIVTGGCNGDRTISPNGERWRNKTVLEERNGANTTL